MPASFTHLQSIDRTKEPVIPGLEGVLFVFKPQVRYLRGTGSNGCPAADHATCELRTYAAALRVLRLFLVPLVACDHQQHAQPCLQIVQYQSDRLGELNALTTIPAADVSAPIAVIHVVALWPS